MLGMGLFIVPGPVYNLWFVHKYHDNMVVGVHLSLSLADTDMLLGNDLAGLIFWLKFKRDIAAFISHTY